MSRQSAPAVAPRRHLTERQADTVARLTAATVEELRSVGFDRLTVRNVAARAGVAPATAYTYFASREHLVTEVFWQRLRDLPRTEPDRSRPTAERVGAAFSAIGTLVADEPALASACTSAMLSEDPEVARLRDAIGQHTSTVLRRAVDGDGPPGAVAALEALFSGLMVHAGIGHLDYAEVPRRMEEASRLLFAGPSDTEGVQPR